MNIYSSCGLMDKASDFYVYGHPMVIRKLRVRVSPRLKFILEVKI